MQRTDVMWLAAFALGFLFTFGVVDIPPGLGLFLFMNVLLAAIWNFGKQNSASKELVPTTVSTWLVNIFSGFYILLTLPYLYRLDYSIIGILVLTHLTILFFGSLYYSLPSALHIVDIFSIFVSPIAIGITWVIESVKAVFDLFKENANVIRLVLKVIMYTALSLFVFILFAQLLSQADAEFKQRIDYILDSLKLSEVMGRMVWGVIFSFVMIGLITIVGTMKALPFLGTTAEKAKEKWDKSFAITFSKKSDALLPILVTVPILLLFSLYVWVQFTYLFGQDISAILQKYSFAEYAHRGFAEMLIVGMLTYPVLAWSMSQSKSEWNIPRIVTFVVNSGIVSLLVIMLYSLILRMNLYMDSYGPSVLRLYVIVGAVVVGIVLLVYELFAVMKMRKPGYMLMAGRFFGDYVVTGMIGVLLLISGLSLVPWQSVVVSQSRVFYEKTGKIDINQLSELTYEAHADVYALGSELMNNGQQLGGRILQHRAIIARSEYSESRGRSLFTTVFGVNLSGQRLLATVPNTSIEESDKTVRTQVSATVTRMVNQYIAAITTNDFSAARALYDPQMRPNDIVKFAPGVSVDFASPETQNMKRDIEIVSEMLASGNGEYYSVTVPFTITRLTGGARNRGGDLPPVQVSARDQSVAYVYLNFGFRNGALVIVNSNLVLSYLPDSVIETEEGAAMQGYGYGTYCSVPNRSYLFSTTEKCRMGYENNTPFRASDFVVTNE